MAGCTPIWAEEEPVPPPETDISPSEPAEAEPAPAPIPVPATVIWLNHLDLRPGEDEVRTTFGGTSTGVPVEASGIVLQSITTGDRYLDGEPKEVRMAAGAPPGVRVVGVRVCYALSNARSFITHIRLAQLEQAGAQSAAAIEDGTDLIAEGPVCVDTTGASVDPGAGPLLLSLRLQFGNTADRVIVRGLGLLVEPPQ